MALRDPLVPQPHLYITDTGGRPLDGGKVFFGEPNKDPEFYPIDIFYDDALTLVVAQPVRTKNGFMMVSGNNIRVYAATNQYSIKVLDAYARQIFYQPLMDVSNAELEKVKLDTGITVTPLVSFAVTRVLHDKLQDTLTTRDFGGIGDGHSHPLSERFTTLGKAQEVYPFVTSLSQQIDTAALQSQTNNIPERNIINVGAGKYIGGFDTKSSVVGQGYATEIKVPTGGYGVKVKQFIPNWERACIQKLSILGNGVYNASHDGFGTGVLYDPNDGAAGRWNLDYVGIRAVEIGIHKPMGGIANNFFSVSVEGAAYGYRAKSNDRLLTDHTGNDSFRECHFRYIEKWCIDIDTNHNGWGALTIDNCIFEGCVGGGIRINTYNQTSYQPITLRSLWFEQVAMAETVMHDGVAEIPRQIKLIGVPALRVEDSYLYNIELINSQMITDNCRIDTAALNGVKLVLDDNSSITCDNFNYGGTVTQVPLIRSIASARPQWGQSNSLRGELTKGAVVDASTWNGRVLVVNTFTGEVGVTTYDTLFTANRGTFTTASVDDGALKTGAMEIILEASSEVTLTKAINFVKDKWYVWGVEGKQSGGNGVSLFSSPNVLGEIYWHKGGWTPSFGVAQCTASSTAKPIYLSSFGGGQLRMRLQNFFICEFDNECDALAFANSRKHISKAV